MSRPSLAPKIMSQILEHARAEGMTSGQHLPAQALADVFRVSRAPVISALRLLEKRGLVRSEDNRGFFLDQDAANLPVLAEEDEEAIYFRVADDRLAGRSPDRFSTTEFMRQYQLSRGRAQQLLLRIEDEGWIDRLPGNGWQFSETLTSPMAYAHAYDFRASIEREALLQPGFRIDAEAFAEARARQQQMLSSFASDSRSAVFRANNDFHEMLMRCSGNPFFIDALQRANRLRRLIEYRITTDRSRLPKQAAEHLQLLDLIEGGSLPDAADFLHRHIAEAGRAKVALFNRDD